MNDPRQPQSVPLPPIPQRPLPTPQQPLRAPQQIPQGQPHTLRPPTAAPATPASRPVPAMPGSRPMPATPAARPAPPQAPQPAQPAADAPMELDPIDLEDEQPDDLAPASTGATKIKFGADGMMKKHAWKRATTTTGLGACRVRTFHGKLSDQGLEYLDEAINTVLDEHPEIEIKHVTSNVGMFDGKFKDFAMIVNVWY